MDTEPIPIGKFLADVLTLGAFYHYIIHLTDYSVQRVSDSIGAIHGLNTLPTTLKEITDLIHPADLDFVIEAEKATIDVMGEIGFEHQLHLKNSYCFRMRVADGSYHLFHHQAIHLARDEDGNLLTALNIHTDIEHLTRVNNKIVLIMGIAPRNDYRQVDLSNKNISPSVPRLSRREMEVLRLLAQGLSSTKIAEKLFLSEHTVRAHRRNLLRKTDSKSSNSLIRKSMELGLL